MLHTSQTLDRCVERTVSRVAPELIATPRRKRKARSSRPPRSLRESYLSSNHAPPRHSTPPTSPRSAGHGHLQQERSRGIRKFPRTGSTIPPSQTVPPGSDVSQRREARIHVSSDRVEDNAPEDGVEAEKAVSKVSPRSTIGPVIVVNKNNEVEEQHREWHPDASILREAEQTEDRTRGSSSSRAHRTNSNSKSVDIFSPPESKQTHEGPEAAKDERYRPLPPLDRNDRRKSRKPPEDPL
jgi:hypothetical protein